MAVLKGGVRERRAKSKKGSNHAGMIERSEVLHGNNGRSSEANMR